MYGLHLLTNESSNVNTRKSHFSQPSHMTKAGKSAPTYGDRPSLAFFEFAPILTSSAKMDADVLYNGAKMVLP